MLEGCDDEAGLAGSRWRALQTQKSRSTFDAAAPPRLKNR
jgi:hypothetical protein